MILVTLGTQKEQFTRLLDYIENSNIDDEIIVQAGHTKYKSKKMKIFDFIPYEKMNEYIEKADVIITHAGTGSVLMPLKKGKKVIVCARLEKNDEHVDDHQKQLVEVFKDEGYVLELNEDNNLDDLMKQLKNFNQKKYKSNSKIFKSKLKKEIENTKVRNNSIILITMMVFFTFLLISYFIPLTGDDWTNANFNTHNIFHIFSIAASKYMIHEGRFASRIFVILFTNTKWLWNIFNALLISIFYYFSLKIINSKNKFFMSIIFAFSMFMIENTIFTQSYLWVTGNVTYFLPMALTLIYIYIFRKVFYNDFCFNKIEIVFGIILNILIPTMVEHISVSLLFINLLFIIYVYIKSKKINKILIVNFILSMIGFLVIYLSPGAHLRAEEMSFSKLNFFDKLITNIPNFISFTYIQNILFVIILFILINSFIYKKLNHRIKYLIMMVINFLPLITIFANLLEFFIEKSSKARNLYKLFDFSIQCNSISIIIFWIIITLVLLFINVDYLKETKKIKPLFFFIIGIIANIAMLLSPIWGGRTELFTLMMLTIDIFVLLKYYIEIEINKYIKCFVFIVFVGYMFLLLVLYHSVYEQQKIRVKTIKNGIKKNSKVINVERFPDKILWNSNAYNEFHDLSLKKYYNISEKVEINRVKVGYKYQLIYNRK